MSADKDRWSKVATKLVDLIDYLNDYSNPDELVKTLDNVKPETSYCADENSNSLGFRTSLRAKEICSSTI